MKLQYRAAIIRVAGISGLFLVLIVSRVAAPGQGGAPSVSPVTFTDVTQAAGINFHHTFGEEKLSNIVEATGAGCGWIDYNNDGLLDLYLVNGTYLEGITGTVPPPGWRKQGFTDRLYRNNGNGTFADVTRESGAGDRGYGMGVAVGDYDDDGFADLYVTNYGRNTLYHNNGDGTFTDVTLQAGVAHTGFSVGAVFFDYNNDGYLDLYVGNYLKFDPDYKNYYAPDNFPGPLSYEGEADILYHNNGDGTFTDVTRKSGIYNPEGRAMGVTSADLDEDGYADIYVANDAMKSFLFRNNHNGTFTDLALEQGVAYGENGEATSAMGPVFSDYDNDGHLDLFVSDLRYHRLYRWLPNERFFEDTTAASGVARISGQYVGWGTAFFDYDNDGRKDIFVVNGGLHHLITQEHSLLRNNGDGTFSDAAPAAGPFFQTKTVGRGACFADYDNDGDVDVYILNLGSRGILLRNDGGNQQHWLIVKLVGTRSNRGGVGARVALEVRGQGQLVEVQPGSGYLSSNDPRAHFGLGSRDVVGHLTVRWPSGTIQKLSNVRADQILTIVEPVSPEQTSASGVK